MSVQRVCAKDAIERLDRFDAIVDARSEDEFALDRLPGAVNWPSLTNEQRELVGALYAQVSPFEARKRGAALVAANVARHIEEHVADKPKGWQPLVYCWRGGQRSGSLALVLGEIGFRVHVVEGGYKAFRAAVVADMTRQVARLRYHVVCGPTGSGKTRLLRALQTQGAQVLDLEALAVHRSSVLGLVPGADQPSQKNFDTSIWDSLRRFDAERPVFLESESRKVGNVALPDALAGAMRTSPCLQLDLANDERVGLLMEDYEHFVRDPELLCDRLAALTDLRGKEVVHAWQARTRAGDFPGVVRELLSVHYDPSYAASMRRNFSQYVTASRWAPANRSNAAFAELARVIVASVDH